MRRRTGAEGTLLGQHLMHDNGEGMSMKRTYGPPCLRDAASLATLAGRAPMAAMTAGVGARLPHEAALLGVGGMVGVLLAPSPHVRPTVMALRQLLTELDDTDSVCAYHAIALL
jgi:hypothetical protein